MLRSYGPRKRSTFLLKKLSIAVLTACSLLVTSSVALADYVFADNNLAVVARKTPCSGKALAVVQMYAQQMPELAQFQWGNADITILDDGTTVKACWTPYKEFVLLVDEHGEGGTILQSKFRELKDV